MTTKLTDRLVLSLAYDHEGQKVNDITWDTLAPGLGIKVGKSGRKTWLVQFYPPGKRTQSRRVLGPYPGLSLELARQRCREWFDMVRLGQDPQAVEQAVERKRSTERDATFGKAAADYLGNRRKLGHRHVDQDEKEINRHLVSHWGERSLASITKADVRERIEAVRSRAPAVGYTTFGHARQIFNFAIDGAKDYGISTSPFDRLKPKHLGLKKEEGDRVLDDGELVAFWRATGKLEYPEQHFYRWLLLTGCRRGDAAGAPWREINLARNVWVIPKERFKQKSAHTVPLTPTMLALLDTMPRNGEWLFSHDGVKHLNGFAKLKNKIDALIGDAITEDWDNHDLRRTMRTNLSGLGIVDHVAEMTIGHARKGIQRLYDRHRYEVETRAALEAWHTRLAQLVS